MRALKTSLYKCTVVPVRIQRPPQNTQQHMQTFQTIGTERKHKSERQRKGKVLTHEELKGRKLGTRLGILKKE